MSPIRMLAVSGLLTPAAAAPAAADSIAYVKDSNVWLASPDGTHQIAASIVTDGLARPPQVAARFRAPRIVIPAAPRNVQLRRTGRTVTVAWRPGAHLPQRWHVQLQAGPARSIATFLSPSRHSLTMRDVASALRSAWCSALAGSTAARAAR